MSLKKIMRTLFATSVAVTLTLSQVSAMDSDKLQVGWVPEVYSVHTGQDDLLDDSGRQRIKEAISNRLKELEASANLPFSVKYGASGMQGNFQESYSGEAPLSILPIVLQDESFDTHIVVGNVSVWRHVIVSGMNIAICEAETADNQGMKMLAVVPLSGYITVGDPRDNGGNFLSQELSLAEKRKTFADISVALIKQMDFNAVSKALTNWQKGKIIPRTTQVDVNISSKKAKDIFKGHESQIQNLIANTYSAEYQKISGNLVMPPRTTESLYKDVGDNMYAFEMTSPSGKVKMSMGKPDKTIVLDFYGVAEAVAEGKKGSNVRQDIVYKAWLKKEPVDGKEAVMLDEVIVEPQYKVDSAHVDIDKKDIYARLEMKLAKKMAAQKR